MKNYAMYLSFFILIITLVSCSSTRLLQQYTTLDTVNFQANKVLVVGISADKDLRRTFEKKVVDALEKEDVTAVKSIDFFETSFTNNKQSLKQLGDIENKLLEAGFDAILFTKITARESKVTMVDAYRNFAKGYQTFEDYYYGNQYVYFKEQHDRYQVYTTETSLYCICPGKERELLWRADIEVVGADKINKNINNYTSLLLQSLKENQLLILEE
ncbi:hypothetical protein [Ulvibacter litoralis]|nr:hypothetical protein [Ulvibacter litoralis]GHC61936.1 hypothetical protein GCM10008083_28750 [Ulvibacter litoralis]